MGYYLRSSIKTAIILEVLTMSKGVIYILTNPSFPDYKKLC